jgi:hypothetical protein
MNITGKEYRVLNVVPGRARPLVVKMNTTLSSSLAAKAPGYAKLQRQMHDALRAQHPEWILPNGDCPTCGSYESRLVELLTVSLAPKPAVGTADFSMPGAYAEATKIVFPPSPWEPDSSFMNCFCEQKPTT